MARTEGILAGPVYTGRALGGLLEMIRQRRFETGETVDVTGTSKGRGFAGGVKRYNFKGVGDKAIAEAMKDMIERSGKPPSLKGFSGSEFQKIFPTTLIICTILISPLLHAFLDTSKFQPSPNLLALTKNSKQTCLKFSRLEACLWAVHVEEKCPKRHEGVKISKLFK